MKYMPQLKAFITFLVVLCVVCAAAAFFLPTTPGAVFSYAAMGTATAIAVLSIAGMVSLFAGHHHTAA